MANIVAIIVTSVLSIAALPKPVEVGSAAAPAGGNVAAGRVRSPSLQLLPGATPKSLFLPGEASPTGSESGSRRQLGGAVPTEQTVPRPGLASWYPMRPVS